MNRQQIPGDFGPHQTFRTLNKSPIGWTGRGFTHACEGADVHSDVRLIWTRCEIDVAAGEAFIGDGPAVDCPRCLASDGLPLNAGEGEV